MINETELYSSFIEEEHHQRSKKLKLGVVTNFLDTFSANGINYIMDDEVKKALNKTVEYYSSKPEKVEVLKFSLTADEINKLLARVGKLFRHACTTDCAVEAANHYLNDSHRFGIDSPYRSFEQFVASPLLSQTWSNVYKSLLNTSNQSNCKKSCTEYNEEKEELITYYLSLGQVAKVDAIILPSVLHLPFLQNSTRPANSSTSLMTLATCTSFPALSMPIGFSNATKNSPQGLPIGAALIGQPKSLLNMFKIAKIYEEKTSGELTKLPFSTPEIETRLAVNSAGYSKLSLESVLVCLFLINFLEHV
jgi:Asp-tRNA(Asn)/Glu-tRNA(Gln) amidotransferase A subunit family amidase